MIRTLVALLVLLPSAVLAQSVTLVVPPFPSPYVADWEVQPGNFSLAVMNGPVEQDLVMILTIDEIGGSRLLEAESDPEFFAANESRVYSSTSEFGGTIDYDSGFGSDVLRTGRLPEGEFRICVRVEDVGGAILVPEECTDFAILFPDPPYLVSPFDEDVVPVPNPLFQWTPLQVPLDFPISYRLQIAEVLDGQTPYQALTSNLLHFDEQDLVFESLEYPIDASPLEDGTRYAWWVQALDENGLAAAANLGRSEVWTFLCDDQSDGSTAQGDPQSVRFVSADQATGPLADFDSSTFEQVSSELNALQAAGSAIEIPLALDQVFDPVHVQAVHIYLDTQRKSLAIRGEKIIRGKTWDVMFSAYWGSRHDPRSKALAIKGPGFEGFFPGGGPLDELASSQAWFVVAGGNHKLTSSELPPQVQDYYGDDEIDVKRGLNLHSAIDIHESGWLATLTEFLNIDAESVDLHGYVGPAINAVFSTDESAKVKLGAEAELSAKVPLWRTDRFDGVIREMNGEIQIAAEAGYKASADSAKSGGEVKVSGQIAIEAKVALPFLAASERLADEITFTGAAKVEKGIGEEGVEVSLELGADDVIDLPAFENVFSLHDPKVTVTYQTHEKKRAIAFSAKADVGRYKNAATMKIQRASAPATAKVDTDSTDGETPPPGGVPTPFKQAELLAKQKEREEAAKKKPAPGREGKWSAEVSFDPSALAAIRPRELLLDLFNFAGNLDMLPEGPTLHSLGIRFMPQDPGTMVVAGSATLLDVPAFFIASRVKSAGGKSGVLFGVAPHEWSFSETFPDAEIPLLSDLELSNVGLLFASEEFETSSDEIYGEEYGFYRSLYGRDDFRVVIKPGMNLVASLPVGEMDPDSPLIPLMDKLGVERGSALVQGAIGTKIEDLYLRASLPPMSPPGAPEWFEYGQLDLELTGQPSIGLIGSIAVRLEDDIVVFFVKTKAGREGLLVAGGMDAPDGWHGPFGVEWMTLNRAVLLLGLTPTGSVQMGFEGDLEVGETDVRVAVLAALNVATGVPTNFMVDGESEAGVSIADLLELQAAIEAAKKGGEPDPIPSDKLPLLAVEDLKLKFAPKDSPELNIERGLAIGGMLGMQPAPDEPADLIAAAEFDVGEEGVIARAAVGDFELGPVSLSNASVDLTLTRAEQYFRLSGDADLTIMSAAIDVDMALTEMTFDAEGEVFEAFMADVHAVGKANLQDPQFTIDAELKNDFNREAAHDLLAQALVVAQANLDASIRARDVAVSTHTQAVRARNSARQAWLNTPVLPRGPKNAARARFLSANWTAWARGMDRARRTTAVVVWTGVVEVLERAEARMGSDPVFAIRSARFNGDLSNMKDGQVAKLDLVVEVEGDPMRLSNAGFNFRDMGPGLRALAEEVVRLVFRSRA